MRAIWTMIRREVAMALRRPLFWIFLALMLLFHTVYYYGEVQIQGDVISGGLGEEDRVHINGPYSLTLWHMIIPFAVATLFAAFAMGTGVIRDRELGVETVLRGTRMSARQYLLGKFCGAAAWVLGVVFFSALVGYGNDVLSAQAAAGGGADDPRIFGDPNLVYHLIPLLCYALPWLLFVMALSFWLGVRTGSTMYTFLPVMIFFGVANFLPAFHLEVLDRWAQDTLDLEWKYVLGWLDPSGLSWLTANYGSEDRGVEYYNTVIPVADLGFAIQRAAMTLIAALLLVRALARYARTENGPLAAIDSTEAHAATPARAGPPKLLESPLQHGSVGIAGVCAVELKLLLRQPAVAIFSVWLLLISVPAALMLQEGAWGAEVHATAATASLSLVQQCALWACGLGAFLAVEVLHRERVTRFGEIYFASPVRERSVFWGKVTALTLVMSFIVALTTAVTALLQPLLHPTAGATAVGDLLPFTSVLPALSDAQLPTLHDLGVYAETVGVLLLPGVVFFVVLGTLAAVLSNRKLTAYGFLMAFTTPYVVGVLTGWLDWRGLVIPSGLVTASDITGLSPYAEPLFWNRVLIASVTLGALLLAERGFRRTDAPLSAVYGPRALRRRKPRVACFLACLAAVGWAEYELSGLIRSGADADWREDRLEEYARLNRVKWGDREGRYPEYQRLELRVDLHPEERAFEVDGKFTFVNKSSRSFPVMPLTVGLDWDIQTTGCVWVVSADGQESEAKVRDRQGLYEVRLPEVLEPGGEVTLHMKYGGQVAPGSRRNNGGFSHWILPDAVFLDSFGPVFLPQPGYVETVQHNEDVYDEEATPAEMARMFEGVRRALLGGFGAFHVDLLVSVPAGLTALSSGVLLSEGAEEGGRRVFRYRTDAPVYFFPIMAGRYETKQAGDCVVYHSNLHPQNIDTIATALDQARRFYSKVYSPYPYQELRIVEFPALAGFAMGHPTLIPFSESIGFLTKGDDGVSNVNFMVVAHEVAHQWWGTVVTPCAAPGAPFLTEALAHYSTLLMEERFEGRVSCRNRRAQWERLYVEARRVDVERPIVRIDGSEPGDAPTWYNKGGWVFWMVSETMGRERFLAALRAFIDEFSFQDDHPTLHDLLRHLREHGGEEIEAHLDQWFFQTVLPAPRVTSAEVDEEDGVFTTRMVIENEGSGRFPLTVEVADRRLMVAERGAMPVPVRIEADDLADPLGWIEELERTEADEPYRAVRGTVQLEPGASLELQLESDFRPTRVLLDPDVQLMMSGRNLAKFAIEESP